MNLQYPCHFCLKREGSVSHKGYWSCKMCQKNNADHSKCKPENCAMAAARENR